MPISATQYVLDARTAVEWITRRMDSSDLGMIECLRRNPDGIPDAADVLDLGR